MAGLYFEQFEVNHVFKHEITRSVTESDNMLFCNMTLNPQPLHIDFNFAKDTEFGQPLVNSLFTLGLVIGISVYDTTIANLGMENTQFPNPVFHGDTIRVETRVVSLRESKSRPMAGIVVFEHKGINQRGDVVCLCTRSAFMRKRPN